jgi:branched-chain amino acid transport system substrate-binding protein
MCPPDHDDDARSAQPRHGLTRRRFQAALLAAGAAPRAALAADKAPPVILGIDGEFGLVNSTSAQAVELGVKVAVEQINQAGGVLKGRPLAIVIKDHRSIPARGIRNIEEFAAMPDVLAVFGGRFSPVVIEQLPLLKATRMPFLAVWSAADAIVDNGSAPNFAFRLSLRDGLAMPFMMQEARQRGIERVGLLLTNTSWGRSNQAAVERYAATQRVPQVIGTAWYNWQETTLIDKYHKLIDAGAQAVLLVANDDEAAVLVREMAALPRDKRVPVLSHWGVTGGRFAKEAGPALREVDFSVIQTFSFFRARQPALDRFMATARRFGVQRIEDIESPVGVAHAYDMTHILAKAINLAGRADRAAVRDALEHVPSHDGLIKRYAPPFTPQRHEALGPAELLMARYRDDGVIVPMAPDRRHGSTKPAPTSGSREPSAGVNKP